MRDESRSNQDLLAEIDELERRLARVGPREAVAPATPPRSVPVDRDDVFSGAIQLGSVDDLASLRAGEHSAGALGEAWSTPEISLGRVSPQGPGLDPGPVAAPGLPSATDATLPWQPWRLDPALSLREAKTPRDSWLDVVTAREKTTVDTLAEVPPALKSECEVSTTPVRPRSWNPKFARYDWYPPCERAFVLHLQDAFIGDNVVFDRERYYRLGRWWLGHSWELYRQTREVRHVDVGVSIGAWCGEAFQHLILHALPKLALVIDLLETPAFADARIVTHCEGAAAAKWFWRALGLEDRIVQKPINAESGFVVHADVALFPQFEPHHGVYGLFPRNTLRPLQQRLGSLEPQVQDLVVYMDRPDHGQIRSVANRDELLVQIESLLAGSGYQLHRFQSRGDQSEDREIMRRAKVVVGPHGGAFANIVFAQPGTHVIEFLPLYRLYQLGQDPRACYWGTAQAAGLDYWTVEAENFDFDQPGMVVDCTEVTAILRSLLS